MPIPTPSDNPLSIDSPVYWSALQVKETGVISTFAQRQLNDAGSYYGGYKAPRLLDISSIKRDASDWFTGAWQTQSASLTVADTDFYFRNLFGLGTPRSYSESALWIYMISEAQRRAGGTPRLLFYGNVYDDPLSQGLTVTFQANDIIGGSYNLFAEEEQVPNRLITKTDFPNIPDDAHLSDGRELGVPIIYGRLNDETGLRGIVRLINVGAMTLNGTSYPAVGLLCGHAVSDIISIYKETTVVAGADYGSSIWAPGYTGWTTIVPSGALYNDIGGNRYTLIPMSGTHATDFANGVAYTVNVEGIEDVGDGTGTLISDLVLQYKHALVNWMVGNYASGAWLTPATYEFFPGGGSTLSTVDTDSFDTANALLISQFGGSKGAFVIGHGGNRTTARQVLQDINISLPNVMLRVDMYGRLSVVALNLSRSALLSGKRTSDWRMDILKDPPRQVTRRKDWHFNDLSYQFAQNYTDGRWIGADEVFNSDSITRYGRTLKLNRQYPCLRDNTSAQTAAIEQLNFMIDPPRFYTWSEALGGLRNDVLDAVPITDYAGSGSSGFVNRAIWIVSQTINPKTNTVLNVGIDVDPLLS